MKNIALLFLGLFLAGCYKEPVKMPEPHRPNPKPDAVVEDLKLLSLKYEIKRETLTAAIIDYEKATQGFSFTELLLNPAADLKKEGLDVQKAGLESPEDAVKAVALKHKIPEKTFAAVLIDRRMMEGGTCAPKESW